jgi:hypothetical protein
VVQVAAAQRSNLLNPEMVWASISDSGRERARADMHTKDIEEETGEHNVFSSIVGVQKEHPQLETRGE